jgi:hypothetical protein
MVSNSPKPDEKVSPKSLVNAFSIGLSLIDAIAIHSNPFPPAVGLRLAHCGEVSYL